MGMSAFGLMILLCLLSSVCVKSASILENSGDLWQNWLLNENEEVPSQQSSPLSRRITPKSVFIAPAFSRCSEGYRLDQSGDCVKIVRVNDAAQLELLLERLKIMSAQLGFNKKQAEEDNNAEKLNSKPDSYAVEDNAGPFQLSIPFNSKNTSENNTTGDPSSAEKSKEITERTSTTIKMTETTGRDTYDYTEETSTSEADATTSVTTEWTSTGEDSTEITYNPTEESITEPTPNTASHLTEYVTEISTLPVTRKTPNYSTVVPLKSAQMVADKYLVEQIPVERVKNSRPSAYTDISAKISAVETKKPSDEVADTNTPTESYQKLPTQRTKPVCDPSKYDCILQFNVLPTDSPRFTLNRKPSTAFVRFPETPTKGFVRFPVQKVPVDYDVAFAESNTGFRYWNQRYPTSWWTSWKSKPQVIRIAPDNGMYAIGDMNYIRSHGHFQTQTEWYNSR